MARLFNVTFHSLDPVRLGRFWSSALGSSIVTESHDLVRIASGTAGPDVLILRVAERPTASAVHLDLADPNVGDEVRRLVALGARVVDADDDGHPVARSANGIEWYVLTDPDGNEFCVGGEPG